MKIKNIKNNGITLIELVISLGFISIIISLAVSIYIYNSRTFADGVAQYDVQSSVRQATDSIEEELRYATEVKLLNTTEVGILINDISTSSLDDPKYNGFKFIYLDPNNNIAHTEIDYGGNTTEYILKAPADGSLNLLFGTDGNTTSNSLTFNIIGENILRERLYDIKKEVQILNLGLGENNYINNNLTFDVVGVRFMTQKAYLNSLVPFTFEFNQWKDHPNNGPFYAEFIVSRPDTELAADNDPDDDYDFKEFTDLPADSIRENYSNDTETRLVVKYSDTAPISYDLKFINDSVLDDDSIILTLHFDGETFTLKDNEDSNESDIKLNSYSGGNSDLTLNFNRSITSVNTNPSANSVSVLPSDQIIFDFSSNIGNKDTAYITVSDGIITKDLEFYYKGSSWTQQ